MDDEAQHSSQTEDEARGVRRGQGSRNDQTSGTVPEVAAERRELVLGPQHQGVMAYPLTQTTCFSVWTISTRLSCAANPGGRCKSKRGLSANMRADEIHRPRTWSLAARGAVQEGRSGRRQG